MGTSILLVGATEDQHVKHVADSLRIANVKYINFDIHDISNLLTLSYQSSVAPSASVRFADKDTFNISNVTTIWWRLKPRWAPFDLSQSSRANWDFRINEWRTCLRGLYALTPHAKWINDVERQSSINDKPFQLALASRVGLNIPRTIIGNNPCHIADLFQRAARVIYKPLTFFVFPNNNIIFTNEISIDDVLGKYSSIMECPGIFQEFIEKDYEIRVTIIGSHLFTVRINTPRDGAGEVDWRHNQFDDIFEEYSLDSSTTELLLRFHKEAGLTIGTYDLIAAKNGEIVFLECNPAGQWLWLEERLGLPITEQFVRELISTV